MKRKNPMSASLSPAEADVVRASLASCSLPFEQLLTLPDWLLTSEVLSAQLERDARLLTLLPERFVTKSAVLSAVRARNFDMSMCPERMLDSRVCELFAKVHSAPRDVPTELLTEAVCVKAVEDMMANTGDLDEARHIPRSLLTSKVMEALLKKDAHVRRLSQVVGVGPFYDALWTYAVTHDTRRTRLLLYMALDFNVSGRTFVDGLLDINQIPCTTRHSSQFENPLFWKVVIAIGEIDPPRVVGRLARVRRVDRNYYIRCYLDDSGDSLGQHLSRALDELDECEHVL